MGMVSVTALQPFYGTEEGKVVEGQVFSLSEGYARDLARRGLVTVGGASVDEVPKPVADVISNDRARVVLPDLKVKPTPNNKMLPSPANKAA